MEKQVDNPPVDYDHNGGSLADERSALSTVPTFLDNELRMLNRQYSEVWANPVNINVLDDLSNGYKLAESAQNLDISSGTVQSRRKLLMKYFNVQTTCHMVVRSIQTGHLLITVEENPVYARFLPKQDAILRLFALGWTMHDIAREYELTSGEMDSQAEEIRKKLMVRNKVHSMRRAFELSIFKIGEDILHPDDVKDDSDDLSVLAVGTKIRAAEIGIVHPHEIELLQLLGGVKNGSFVRSDLYELGFYSEAPSPNARAQAYGRAIIAISRKLEAAYGAPILEKAAIKARRYVVRQTLLIGAQDDLQEVPKYHQESSSDTVLSVPPKRKRRPVQPSLVEDIQSESKVEESAAYLDFSELPELTEDFLASLQPRDPKAVLENHGVKVAVSSILGQDLLRDYRSRAVIPLRYGIEPSPSRRPFTINRAGTYIKLDQIMPYVMKYQGLGLQDVSQITGLALQSILKSEKEFIEQFHGDYPVLTTLMPYLDAEIRSLEPSFNN